MFADREEAGRRLAAAVKRLRDENVIVLGLPRGGVPVAAVVARHLDAPLDVIVVRKLGLPYQPELGLGAVGEGGVRVINEALLQATGFSAEDLAEVEERECAEVEARAIRFRGDRPPITLTGRTVILIDDGIATGSTMRAACLVARALSAGRVVVAAPVAAKSSLSKIEEVADEVICLHTPRLLNSVGEWYRDFSQTSVAEVVRLLPGSHPDVTGAPAPNRSS
ncbi:phosphoribosyltransferase [Kribbella qitaiheensis]|uniref:phosphoribosyltransferase n=1 Tax=Kribbella qitaiheensis TaxID=1544730 RepID=UPI00360C3FFD